MLLYVELLCTELLFVVVLVILMYVVGFFFFQAEDGIRDLVRSRGLGDVYKRQVYTFTACVNAGSGDQEFPVGIFDTNTAN